MTIRALILLLTLFASPVYAQTQQPPPKPSATDEFVPVDKPLNAQETIPAPRLVAIAYGFIWVALFGYIWSVRSRLSNVERELETVSKRVGTERR